MDKRELLESTSDVLNAIDSLLLESSQLRAKAAVDRLFDHDDDWDEDEITEFYKHSGRVFCHCHIEEGIDCRASIRALPFNDFLNPFFASPDMFLRPGNNKDTLIWLTDTYGDDYPIFMYGEKMTAGQMMFRVNRIKYLYFKL